MEEGGVIYLQVRGSSHLCMFGQVRGSRTGSVSRLTIEEGEEEPILVTDAAAKEDLAGGTHSTLVKSLFLAGVLGQHIFHLFETC